MIAAAVKLILDTLKRRPPGMWLNLLPLHGFYCWWELLMLRRRIAILGLPKQKMPCCQRCHDRTGRARNPFYPYLEGQLEG